MAPSGGLAGRWALVTGASRGIGSECARLLHAEGANLVLMARDLGRLRALAGSLGDGGARVEVTAGDLADPYALDRALRDVRDIAGGAPDIIVNNAAAFFLRPAHETTVREFERTVAVNLTAAFAIVHEFLPDMRARGSGHIVSIGSIADHRAFRGNAAYGASKHAVRGLHEVLRAELRGSGVRTTLVSPGHTDTGIWEGVEPEMRGGIASRDRMLSAGAVAEAVRWAVTRAPEVDVEEIRLARS